MVEVRGIEHSYMLFFVKVFNRALVTKCLFYIGFSAFLFSFPLNIEGVFLPYFVTRL